MDTVCYIHYVLQPHIYYVLQKLDPPPPENPRSAPGGVFLAFIKNLKFTEQPNLSQNVEMIWAKIYPVSNKSCLVCSFYRPPDALNSPILSLKEALQHTSIELNETKLILC